MSAERSIIRFTKKEELESLLKDEDLERSYLKTVAFVTSAKSVYFTEYWKIINQYRLDCEVEKYDYSGNKQKFHLDTLDVMSSKIPLVDFGRITKRLYSLSSSEKKLDEAKWFSEMMIGPYFSPVYLMCSNKEIVNSEKYELALNYLFDELYEVEEAEKAKKYFKHFMVNVKRSVLQKKCDFEQLLSLYGLQGNGKSQFADCLCKALQGKEYKESLDRMLARFNNVLIHTGIIHVEEFGYIDKTQTDSLKSLITTDSINIEQKGKEIITIPKRFQIMMTSNRNPQELFYGEVQQRRSAIIRYLGYRHNFDMKVLQEFLKKMWETCPVDYDYNPSELGNQAEDDTKENTEIFETFANEFHYSITRPMTAKGINTSLDEDIEELSSINPFQSLFSKDGSLDENGKLKYAPRNFRKKTLINIFSDSNRSNKLGRHTVENFLNTQSQYVTKYNDGNYRFTKKFFDKLVEMEDDLSANSILESKSSPEGEEIYTWKRPSDDFTEELKKQIGIIFG